MKSNLRIRGLIFGMLLAALALAAAGQSATSEHREGPSKPKSEYFNAARMLKDIEYLASDELEGRSADRESIAKARGFVERRFAESGLVPIGNTYRQDIEITERGGERKLAGVNFIGQIKGDKNPDKYIVISAHYDHVGVRNGEIYNGADDNASGTAALFALAEYFSRNRPEHSLVFVAFDAEERGLQGARHFVGNLPVAKGSILLNVNMDMLSRSDKGELYAAGAHHYLQFRPMLEAMQKKARVKLLLGHDDPELGSDDWTNQSDHGAFHRIGIPFIYFGVEDHKDYHKPTDDFANIHPEFYVRAVETVIEALKIIDSAQK